MGKPRKSTDSCRDKLTYLSFVQSNISRMSNYSCAIKGSCCALVIAQIALLQHAATSSARFIFCCLLVSATIIAFSLFDSRYLQLEKQYRVLYRIINEAKASFPTDLIVPKPSVDDGTRRRDAFFSWSVFGFYLSVLSVCICTLLLTIQ